MAARASFEDDGAADLCIAQAEERPDTAVMSTVLGVLPCLPSGRGTGCRNVGWFRSLPDEGETMPRAAWSAKRERQYKHIKSGLERRGDSETEAEGDRGADGEQGAGSQRGSPAPELDLHSGHLVRSPRWAALTSWSWRADPGPALRGGSAQEHRGPVQDEQGATRSRPGPLNAPRLQRSRVSRAFG